jgi:hypothetical protein
MNAATDKVTARAITAGIRDLEQYITDHAGFAEAMNVAAGPEMRIRLNSEAEIDAFADHFHVTVTKAPVGDGLFMVATAQLEGVAVAAWARTDSEVPA